MQLHAAAVLIMLVSLNRRESYGFASIVAVFQKISGGLGQKLDRIRKSRGGCMRKAYRVIGKFFNLHVRLLNLVDLLYTGGQTVSGGQRWAVPRLKGG